MFAHTHLLLPVTELSLSFPAPVPGFRDHLISGISCHMTLFSFRLYLQSGFPRCNGSHKHKSLLKDVWRVALG